MHKLVAVACAPIAIARGSRGLAVVFLLLFMSSCSSGDSTLGDPGFVPTPANLPVIRITTTNGAPVTSKDDYIDGHMQLTPPAGSSFTALESDLQIKGHGNTSWTWSKKPYKIKLADKSSVLGMPAQKNWILLANFDDKTLLRNDVAFELGRRVGMAWSPRSQFVELYLNGQYEGSYQLTESIEIDPNRVNINSLGSDDVTMPKVSGGYLMEVDFGGIATADFLAGGTMPITMHDPSPMAPEQKTYITNYVNQVQSVLNSANFADPGTGYAQYIDSDSFIDWFLVNEIFKNNDAAWWSSVYLYKARNGKIYNGPLWDFDLGAGNTTTNNNEDPTGWWVANAGWTQLLLKDPVFRQKVQTRWKALKVSQFDSLSAYIDSRAAALGVSEVNNFGRWPVLNTVVYTEPELAGSYAGEVTYMKQWLAKRIAWMDSQINSPAYVQ